MYYETSQVLKAQQTISETKSLWFVLRLCLLCLQCIHRPNSTRQTSIVSLQSYLHVHGSSSKTISYQKDETRNTWSIQKLAWKGTRILLLGNKNKVLNVANLPDKFLFSFSFNVNKVFGIVICRPSSKSSLKASQPAAI